MPTTKKTHKHPSSLEGLGRLSVSLLLLACVIVSCKPSIPSGIISEGDMEDILYDYHLANAIAQQDGNLNKQRMYNDILEKYDYTQAEFDSSMVYYTRHYRLLDEIYKNIEGRMAEQAVAMGGNVQDLNSMGEGFSSADTTNVWTDVASIVFTQYPPYSVKSFEIKVDSAYKAGDKFLLSFDTDFIVQDGRRDLAAMLAVRFKNDSVAYNTQHFSSAMHATMIVDDTKRLGVKSISGFITFCPDAYDSQTTTKIALARNIKLIRMHTEDPAIKAAEQAKADSLRMDSLNKLNNNGIQETPLDSTGGATNDSSRRESALVPEERQTRP